MVHASQYFCFLKNSNLFLASSVACQSRRMTFQGLKIKIILLLHQQTIFFYKICIHCKRSVWKVCRENWRSCHGNSLFVQNVTAFGTCNVFPQNTVLVEKNTPLLNLQISSRHANPLFYSALQLHLNGIDKYCRYLYIYMYFHSWFYRKSAVMTK